MVVTLPTRPDPMTKTPIAVLGIELSKNSCSLAGMDAAGALVSTAK